jgi:hypothetical protein
VDSRSIRTSVFEYKHLKINGFMMIEKTNLTILIKIVRILLAKDGSMTARFQHFMVALLVFILGVGCMASAAAGVINCIPERCCCTAAAVRMTERADQIAMPAGRCNPQKAAPCCHVEPLRAKSDAAVSSIADPVSHRIFMAGPPLTPADVRAQSGAAAVPFPEDGRLKIPLVPIYLQTQSILC